MRDFVHLHVRTEHSFGASAVRIKDLIERTASLGMTAVAVTDDMSLSGAVELYHEACKSGIKPIFGCDCRILPNRGPNDPEHAHRVTLLAENNVGYRNLCRLISKACLESKAGVPCVEKKILAQHVHGLIGLSGGIHGEITDHILNDSLSAAESAALEYIELFGKGNFFLEVRSYVFSDQERINQALADIGQRLSVPLVLTQDCRYLCPDDRKAYDVLVCIRKDIQYDRAMDTEGLYLKSPQEIADQFKSHSEAIKNTVRIAERCNVDLGFSTFHVPAIPLEEGETAESILNAKAKSGLEKRLRTVLEKKPQTDKIVYEKRLAFELNTICEKGFAGYFLIVADYVDYARKNNIPAGPGRGSTPGSLVAYCLGITEINPIEYGLVFERFLAPSSKHLPDIDIDFCLLGRGNIIEYINNKYGKSHVAHIAAYGIFRLRVVLRDVGRAMGILSSKIDSIIEMVPEGPCMTLKKAMELNQELSQLEKNDHEVSDLFEISMKLEGLIMHKSLHAAGIVISDLPLTEYVALEKGRGGKAVIQGDMRDIERLGLLKFDLLGLRNLSVNQNVLELIRAQGLEPPDLHNLDPRDMATLRLLQNGNTEGVFSLESEGMREMLRLLQPTCFNDIAALNALYRPGPLMAGISEAFVHSKHNRNNSIIAPSGTEPYLNETYGVLVYQEQTMIMAESLAGYTADEANEFRKDLGKKNSISLENHRKRFIKGAEVHGITKANAKTIFDYLERYGGYAFNKSHSVAYTWISFQNAYLKAHFPVLFSEAMDKFSGDYNKWIESF